MSQMEKVRDGFALGCAQFAEAIAAMPPEKRAFAEKELAMFKAETLHFRSCVDLAGFVMARDKGDVAEMARLARRELEAAKALMPLVRADSRFGYESSNHYFYVPQDLREKVLTCRAAMQVAK